MLVGMAYGFRLNRFTSDLSLVAASASSLLTGHYEFNRLAAYYPAYSLFEISGDIDLFAVVGVVVPLALCTRILREGGINHRHQRVRRAASALHGESDWLPLRQALRSLSRGGIVVGEAYRPDLHPGWAGRAPLLRYDGETGSGHMLVVACSGGY